MKQLPNSFNEQTKDDQSSEFLFAIVRYIPLLSGLLVAGFVAIYVMARTGILGGASWQLLAVTGVVLFVGLSHLPIADFARGRRWLLAFVLYAAVMAVTSVLFVLFWQGILPVALVIAWIPPLTALAMGLRRRYWLPSVVLGAASTAAVFFMDAHQLFPRLASGDLSGLAAYTLLASTVVLFVLATIIPRLIRYRSLQGRLIVSFVLVIAVPILFTTGVSAFSAFINSENQFRDTLQSVSLLKEGQMNAAVKTMLTDMVSVQDGAGAAGSILYVLDRQGESDDTYRLNSAEAISLLRGFMLAHPASRYEEMLVLNMDGNVVLSTFVTDEGLNFKYQAFSQPSNTPFTQLLKFTGRQNQTGQFKLVTAVPFYASHGKDVHGVIVAVSNASLLFDIMAATPGLPNVDTYLVGGDYRPILNSTTAVNAIQGTALTSVILAKSGNGSDLYVNYAGARALGYYAWYPAMQMAIVAEVPESDVLSKAISTLLASGLIGIFTIVIAIVAILSTSRAISEPVTALAKAARKFSAGDLKARTTVGQEDEIGNLAASFNSMADQLQGVIGNLESRVSERTQDLERQSLRLRTAAEVARDAASSRSPDELLERAAALIRDRFNLYHSGIFLLDDKKEYAVLRASPTEAGHKMLENNHRLRVGEEGIVGRAAATGEPRIALDTGADPIYFNNPLLPATRSEMALPLKSNEGIIGVLDIQSDQPEAFTQDDIAIMQVMADQMATAIERSRLLVQVQASLREMERTYGGFVEQSWQTLGRAAEGNIGYTYNNVRLQSVSEVPERLRRSFENGQTLLTTTSDGSSEPGESIAVPLRLRGRILGVVEVHLQHKESSEKTLALLEQVADRLVTALENASLLEDSLRRANKERVIGEITSKISASVNMRNVLQTAVEELGHAMPGSDVIIQFRDDRGARGQEQPS